MLRPVIKDGLTYTLFVANANGASIAVNDPVKGDLLK
jgi:hypothetical protein